MTNKPGLVMTALLAMAVAMGADAFGQERPPSRVSGTFSDYVWVEVGTGAGAWHVTGEWTAQVTGHSGKAEFVASLLGVRSDLWRCRRTPIPRIQRSGLRTPITLECSMRM